MNVMCNVNKIPFFYSRDMSYELCSTFVNVFAFCVNVYIFQIEMSIGRNEGDITRDVMMLISSISLYKLTLYCRIKVWMPYRSKKKSLKCIDSLPFVCICEIKGMHMCTFYFHTYEWWIQMKLSLMYFMFVDKSFICWDYDSIVPQRVIYLTCMHENEPEVSKEIKIKLKLMIIAFFLSNQFNLIWLLH